MFRKISAKIEYPQWARRDERYRRLDVLDRLLDGTFYDHLRHAFYDETDRKDPKGEIIALEDRRPSTQFRLPRMVARQTSRKLFSGRHIPRIRHKDKKAARAIERLLIDCRFWSKFREACLRGSVGSIAMTFCATDDGSVAIDVWQAKFCRPMFDRRQELTGLRVHYVTQGSELRDLGMKVDKPGDQYWYVKDYYPDREATYVPVPAGEWNPVDGFNDPMRVFEVHYECVTDLGFVPGVWIRNLETGTFPDGSCTWEDAIPDAIELDYTLSQVGRGVRYNSAPQLVVTGEIQNHNDQDGPVLRGPSTYIHLNAARKTDGGDDQEGAGSAKLLEMTGSGVEAALKLVESLRKYALEQIEAFRKDPEHMTRVVSGRAMEFLDEESNDLVADLRSCYGEYGALPMIKKIIQALRVIGGCPPELMTLDLKGISLLWPRQFQPTPQDLQMMMPAIGQAMDPLGIAANIGGENRTGPDGGQGPDPDNDARLLKMIEETQLITRDEARAYLAANMDLGILDDPEEGEPDDDPSERHEPDPDGDGPQPNPVEEPADGSDEGGGQLFVGAPAPVRESGRT